MKKIKVITLIIAVLFVFSSVAFADYRDKITTFKTHDGVTIALSGSSTSSEINLSSYRPNGYFSIQVALTGDGTAKFEYLLSNDGTNYLEPSSASDIGTGLTKTGGPGSDGKEIYSFSPELAKHMKIKVTETGGANSITVTVTLSLQ
jgi:hypothetical protein